MSQVNENKSNIAINQEAIGNIKAAVMENKALVYLSRSMIEENRQMILSNYAAAFMGNRQLANQNTDDIVSNTYNILADLEAETDIEKNFVNAAINGMSLKFLRHRSELNSSVLAISEKMSVLGQLGELL